MYPNDWLSECNYLNLVLIKDTPFLEYIQMIAGRVYITYSWKILHNDYRPYIPITFLIDEKKTTKSQRDVIEQVVNFVAKIYLMAEVVIPLEKDENNQSVLYIQKVKYGNHKTYYLEYRLTLDKNWTQGLSNKSL